VITTILAAILPQLLKSGTDVIDKASNKWIGLSVDDQVKLKQADVAKIESLAKLDNPYGTPSQWVVDLRASFRYLAAGVSVLAGVGLLFYGFNTYSKDAITALAVAAVGVDLIGIPFAFIFGDRLNINTSAFTKK